MGNPFEGSRRQDYAEKTPITPTTLNRIQDDMIEAWEARAFPITSLFQDANGGSDWKWGTDATRWHWETDSAANLFMAATIPLKTGSVITGFRTECSGSNAGGYIKIRRRALLIGTTHGNFEQYADVSGAVIADPFDTTTDYQEKSLSGLSITLEAGYEYIVEVKGSDNASVDRMGSFLITAQEATGA